MSTRQKSFFDQDQKPKHYRGQWNRARSGPGYPHYNKLEAPPLRQVVTGPPIMPSSQSRKKLKAFQFIDGAPASENLKMREAEKENISIPEKAKETPKASRVVDHAVGDPLKTPKPVHAKTYPPPPSTPATRLPLAELVGNAEDSRRYAVQSVPSPEEQLYWRGSQTVNTPLPRKGKKRARSSSPAAPSQEELPKANFVTNEVDNLEADPATELWARYTNNKSTPSSKKGTSFDHLINEISPRSSANVGSVSGLRRWASCGLEFPTSAAKRRRARGIFRAQGGIDEAGFDATSSDGVYQAQAGPSKLATMLQMMRESAMRANSRTCPPELPSSSSPLPETGDRRVPSTQSPSQQRHARSQDFEAVENISVVLNAIDEEDDLIVGRVFGSSDEFGDADFDDDLVEALDVSQQDASVPSEVVCRLPEVQEQTRPAVVAAAEIIYEGSDDEFGLDEDIFAADLEQVASMYDNRPTILPAEAVPEMPSNDLPAPVIDLVEEEEDEDFGDDIDVDEFTAAEDAATQGQNTSQQHSRAIQRYLIKQVVEGTFKSERGYLMPQKVLLVEDEKTKLLKTITLRQSWYDTPCTPGSFVHVIGGFSSNGACTIDDCHNMLVLHPDHLISATVVADSFGCLRRAVLQDRIKATSRANPPMLYGTLLHELFQEALKENRWDTEFLLETIDALLPGKFETILEIESTCEQVREHMRSKLPELQAWAELFVRAEPRSDAVVRERNGRQSVMSINKLLDVEEHVWSPMYGLKGNIDATVQVTMQDDQGERTLIVPFEVKTGKNPSASHVAQTALYNLLLSNRYDVEVAYGILYYMETSDISRIPYIRNDIIHMIIKRNELASYVRNRTELPPMLEQNFKCQKCYAQEPCFLYEKLVEDGNGDMLNKKAKERYDELVKPLKPADQEFMKKWDSLLTKEESDMMKFRRELWTMLSDEREKLGRCFSNVILESGSGSEEKSGQKINRYTYTFIKQKPKPGFSFAESQLIIGEPIVVSDEQGHFALANGYVTNVRKRRITVAVDRRLHNTRTKLPGFDSQTNQAFAGIMEVTKENEPVRVPQDEHEPVLYRLDKDEFSNGMAAARNNLIQIMDNNVYKAHPLRSLIVNNRPPTFKSVDQVLTLPTQLSGMAMNTDQKNAITKVMSANDYALVLGMPGTGKTTTIAHIIRALVAKGKSVLLTSYTHSAVDNILLKIRDDDIGILRLGASTKIHPEVRQFAIIDAVQRDGLEELEKSWMDPPVVATTCLTINHPLFSRRIFDYCIVDEASQITLPVCIGPIRMAKTFVLVGDHYQLPPLVQNKEAIEGGLDVSLFKQLCEAHPQAVVNLEHQYRMNADVMLLSNTFIYSGRLQCGNASVASRQLQLPKPNGLQSIHHSLQPQRPSIGASCPGPDTATCWLSRALDPSNSVVFINTDLISPKLETQVGSRITNALEARLITHLVVSLLSLGICPNEIGVIAFYRSQLALLRQSLSSVHTQTQTSDLAGPVAGPAPAGVELHTADKFQGRDKEVVLVSCVRSNEKNTVGDLLNDRRRVNVALTRARSKLVILGSEKTLSGNNLLRDMVALCREKGWVLDPTQYMVDGHLFDEATTQTDKPTKSSNTVPRGCSKPPTPSPAKKRKALGDITMTGGANKKAKLAKKTPSNSPEIRKNGRKIPGKVCTAGTRGVLDGRPVLRDLFNGAM